MVEIWTRIFGNRLKLRYQALNVSDTTVLYKSTNLFIFEFATKIIEFEFPWSLFYYFHTWKYYTNNATSATTDDDENGA